jgi:hypothetical protein
LHAQKQFEQRIVTLFGIQIEDSDEHSRKTLDSIRSSFDFDSKITSRRDLQPPKQFKQRIVIDFGIQIEDSDEQDRKTSESIRSSLASDSKITSRRDLQPDKHFERRIPKRSEMKIQANEAQFEKAPIENDRGSAAMSGSLLSFLSSPSSCARVSKLLL